MRSKLATTKLLLLIVVLLIFKIGHCNDSILQSGNEKTPSSKESSTVPKKLPKAIEYYIITTTDNKTIKSINYRVDEKHIIFEKFGATIKIEKQRVKSIEAVESDKVAANIEDQSILLARTQAFCAEINIKFSEQTYCKKDIIHKVQRIEEQLEYLNYYVASHVYNYKSPYSKLNIAFLDEQHKQLKDHELMLDCFNRILRYEFYNKSCLKQK
jgi:hypothetical protein